MRQPLILYGFTFLQPKPGMQVRAVRTRTGAIRSHLRDDLTGDRPQGH